MLVYMANPATVRINMDKITSASKAEVFRIDPRTSDRAFVGSYPTSGQQSFTTPKGWDDTVLFISKSR